MFDPPSGADYASSNARAARDSVTALAEKVERFERIIRWFLEMPVIWQSPSALPLLTEMGYEIVPGEPGVLGGASGPKLRRKPTT